MSDLQIERKVIALANQEAQRLNHAYLGTEHILLGLVKDGNGVASNVLLNMGINLAKVRNEVEKLVPKKPDVVIMGKLPYTPLANGVIEFAYESSEESGINYIGTEHLLLGLLSQESGVAAQVLRNLDLDFDDVKSEINELLSGDEVPEAVKQIIKHFDGDKKL